jgi:8-oxo-dGTP diphosphatase
MGETLDEAAREMAEETGITKRFLEQLFTSGDPGRDPRGRVVTTALPEISSVPASTLNCEGLP